MENLFGAARLRFDVEILLVLLVVMMGGGVLGLFVVEKNSILVISPDELRGKKDSAIGNFGIPKHGGSMIGNVVYPEKGASACTSFEELGVSLNQHKVPPTPLILLVDRGGCNFAVKAWNAQNGSATAVLIADDREEPLETMESPEDGKGANDYVDKILIPSVLIEKSFGDDLKNSLEKGQNITIKLDWTESMSQPDKRVEYEFWTNSNDECGSKCDDQLDFVKNFKGHAQILEKSGFTQFNPHYITWYCPSAYILSKQCISQCINHGRYCAPDPDKDFHEGYEGKDVVIENLRQLCVFRIANESNRPWVWWDYVIDFHTRCPMKDKKYNKECAESVIKSLGLFTDKVQECMGDPQADAENPVLKAELDMQVGQGRGHITTLPTLVINNVQYRGKLERRAVLKAICALFKETTEPLICLNGDIETNECMTNNGGCWQNTRANITACKDTFRGRICECPLVSGVQFQGDGHSHCEAIGVGRCRIENGGCWSETENGQTFSACSESQFSGCHCPTGFRSVEHKCVDIDECNEGAACQCSDCMCKNKWGGFDCKCKGELLYLAEQDTCIVRNASRFDWFLTLIALAGLVGIVVAGYVFYKYRLRSYMDTEVAAVISQYMTLDNQTDDHQPLQQNSV